MRLRRLLGCTFFAVASCLVSCAADTTTSPSLSPSGNEPSDDESNDLPPSDPDEERADAGKDGGAKKDLVCKADTADCDHSTKNGCEVDLLTDVENCGACGKACSIPNGTSACVAGECESTCNAGFDECVAGCCIPPSAAARLEAGDRATCYVGSTGGLKCWGRGVYGQLGNGGTTDSATPVTPTGLGSGVRTVSVGRTHACAVTDSGSVQCWGSNSSGQLGVANIKQSLVPITVTGLTSGYTAVSAGHVFSCALSVTGGVQCWGNNGDGSLGDGTTTSRATPSDVSGLGSGVVAIATGYSHACALTSTGGVKCWGGTAKTPTDVPGLTSGVKKIATGQGKSCAIRADGAVLCWGTSPAFNPQVIAGVQDAVAITADYTHACAIVAGGTVQCWGGNGYGQLGDGTTTTSNSPVAVTGLGDVVEISAGDWHTCALTKQGVVSCWGMNSNSQLGVAASVDHRPVPGVVSGF